MSFLQDPLEMISSHQSCCLQSSPNQILQLFRYSLSVELNLLLHHFLWKTSASRQHKHFVWMFLLHQSQIRFHYLMRIVSKHNCCNLKMKYHQTDIHTFHDLRLDLWYFRSPTTRILKSSFEPRVPSLGKTQPQNLQWSQLVLPWIFSVHQIVYLSILVLISAGC